MGLAEKPFDEAFLAAIECPVAVELTGFDRLLG